MYSLSDDVAVVATALFDRYVPDAGDNPSSVIKPDVNQVQPLTW